MEQAIAATGGLSKGAKIGMAIGGISVLGIVVYMLTRSSSASAATPTTKTTGVGSTGGVATTEKGTTKIVNNITTPAGSTGGFYDTFAGWADGSIALPTTQELESSIAASAAQPKGATFTQDTAPLPIKMFLATVKNPRLFNPVKDAAGGTYNINWTGDKTYTATKIN